MEQRAPLGVQQAQIQRLQVLAGLKQDQVAALHVRAGSLGVLREVAVPVGQRVAAGTVLAKVAQPAQLKAELKVPETQAKDIQVGQRVIVDARNGTIPGRVVRVDPPVREGAVTVEVRLEGALPPGARPDLSVDGIIEVKNIRDILYVERPVFGQPGGVVSLFRLEPDGKPAAYRRGWGALPSPPSRC
ncbi:MAG: HlyD family efflux transporter periplasmic adaptor subunit [Bryobacterales bacterium]|nr:efflux RND transporter periplasmic adaptor subunit [Bryobacteraceae bacterium]MDW8354024.1 HlyD family efflux transporter periplasmic adaptor subunit [Bryobacterales bacterium]